MSKKFLKPIHLACSEDEMRPIMAHIKIENGIAQATNGYVLVKMPLKECSLIHPDEIEKMNGKLIHKNVWKELMEAHNLVIENDQIHAVTDAGKVIFEFSQNPEPFPNVQTILDSHEVNAVENIGMNQKFLQVIAKIFESPELKFDFNGKQKGILISSAHSDIKEEVAILMPISLN